MGPPAPLLSRTPRTKQSLLDLHVHWANVACFVLPDPQLSVFGWVHFSQQLVHRLDCLQGDTEEGSLSEMAAELGCLLCPMLLQLESHLRSSFLEGSRAPGTCYEGENVENAVRGRASLQTPGPEKRAGCPKDDPSFRLSPMGK